MWWSGVFFWTERWASQVQPAEAKLEPQSGEGWLPLVPYSPWVSGFLLLPMLGQQMISSRNLPGFIFLQYIEGSGFELCSLQSAQPWFPCLPH